MQTVTFHPGQFRSNLTEQEAARLFKICVSFVEIETFTYCNRKCYFCPNSIMPERQDKSGNKYMDEDLYLRIVRDLGSIDYAGQIQFGRYNEPLSDRIILKRIKDARDWCPGAFLYTHTNGDFLTRGLLHELRGAGLNALCVQSYLGNDERWDETRIIQLQHQQLRKLGLRIRETWESTPGQRHYHSTDYPGMEVSIDARNFDAIGTDRGGLVQINARAEDSPRTAPCLIPFSNVYIDVDGSTVPCCNIRSDRPEHAGYVIEKLTTNGMGIFEAYAAGHEWRKKLMKEGKKEKPCDTCRHEEAAVQVEAYPQLERLWGGFMEKAN